MAVNQDIRHKVVVRKLPPGISGEEVQAAIDTVCQGKYDWFAFVPGKVRCDAVESPSPQNDSIVLQLSGDVTGDTATAHCWQ